MQPKLEDIEVKLGAGPQQSVSSNCSPPAGKTEAQGDEAIAPGHSANQWHNGR